jgi:hypothetical protein
MMRVTQLVSRVWGLVFQWRCLWFLLALIHLPAMTSAANAFLEEAGFAAGSRLGWMGVALLFLVLKTFDVRWVRVGGDARSLLLFITAAILFHVVGWLGVEWSTAAKWAVPILATVLLMLSLGSVQCGLQRVFASVRGRRHNSRQGAPHFIPHAAPQVVMWLAFLRRHLSLPPPMSV